MSHNAEVRAFLIRHLEAIQQNDIDTYHATTSPDLTLYEWWVTPHRIEGLPFHDYMMVENEKRGTVFGAETDSQQSELARPRLDLSNLKIQHYGDCAVASYTMLVSSSTPQGVRVIAHNESRVIVKREGEWQVVHVHKSPAWLAPHTRPE